MKKWTILFMIKNIECYSDPVNRMVNEIRRSNLNNSISIILCLNCLVRGIKEIDLKYINQFKLDDLDKTTVFYRIKPANDDSTCGRLELIEEDPSFNIKDKCDVAVFFRDKILKSNEAERYILVTWDHGSAFGIFRDQNQGTGIVANKSIFQECFLTYKFRETLNKVNLTSDRRRLAGKLLYSEEFDMLTMDELRDAIEWGFGKKKIDIVVMMNCYMQFFDTGYALRDHVKYLIATEALVNIQDGFGYDYLKILNKISSNSNISSKRLSKYIVDVYAEKYIRTDDSAKTAISANSLRYYSKISRLIDKLSEWLIKKVKLHSDLMKTTVEDCGEISVSSDYHLVDLLAFLKIFKKRIRMGRSIFLYTELFFITKIAVVRQFVSANLKKKIEGQIICPGGFSVFFPSYKATNNAVFYDTFILESSDDATDFSLYHRWDNFIQKYLESIANKTQPHTSLY